MIGAIDGVNSDSVSRPWDALSGVAASREVHTSSMPCSRVLRLALPVLCAALVASGCGAADEGRAGSTSQTTSPSIQRTLTTEANELTITKNGEECEPLREDEQKRLTRTSPLGVSEPKIQGGPDPGCYAIETSRQQRCTRTQQKAGKCLVVSLPADEAPGRPESAAAATTLARSIETVKACLKATGIEALGGPYDRGADDDNAPDGELVITGATFIAFYTTEARAEQLEEQLQDRAESLGGTTTRHGTITVLYTDAPQTEGSGKPDPRIEECVEATAGDG
jgi:hypothetical protein